MGVFAPTRFVDRGLESGQGGTAVSWMRCRGAVGRLGAVRARGGGPGGRRPGRRGGRLHPGSPGLGDPFFPLAGNGGYDVTNYALRLSYDPATTTWMGR